MSDSSTVALAGLAPAGAAALLSDDELEAEFARRRVVRRAERERAKNARRSAPAPGDLLANEQAALDELVFRMTPGPKTLAEIGRYVGGLSRERVRQIEKAAMIKLRRRLAALGATPADIEPPSDSARETHEWPRSSPR